MVFLLVLPHYMSRSVTKMLHWMSNLVTNTPLIDTQLNDGTPLLDEKINYVFIFIFKGFIYINPYDLHANNTYNP